MQSKKLLLFSKIIFISLFLFFSQIWNSYAFTKKFTENFDNLKNWVQSEYEKIKSDPMKYAIETKAKLIEAHTRAKIDVFWNEHRKRLEKYYWSKEAFVEAFKSTDKYKEEYNRITNSEWAKPVDIDTALSSFFENETDRYYNEIIKKEEEEKKKVARWEISVDSDTIKITKQDEENLEGSLLTFFGVWTKEEAISKSLLPSDSSPWMQAFMTKVYSILYSFYVIIAMAIIIIFIVYLTMHAKWVLWNNKNSAAVWKIEDMLIAFAIIIFILFGGFKFYLAVVDWWRKAVEDDLRYQVWIDVPKDSGNQNMSFDIKPN